MFLGNEEHIQIGKKHLSKIKEMLEHKKNVAQETFDSQPLHMRKTMQNKY